MQVAAKAQGFHALKYLYYTPKGGVEITTNLTWSRVARTHPSRVEQDYLWLLTLARATGLEPLMPETLIQRDNTQRTRYRRIGFAPTTLNGVQRMNTSKIIDLYLGSEGTIESAEQFHALALADNYTWSDDKQEYMKGGRVMTENEWVGLMQRMNEQD